MFSKTHLKCLPRCWSHPTLPRITKGQLLSSSILPTVVILSVFSGGCKSSLCAGCILSYLHRWIYSSVTIISKIHVVTVSRYEMVKNNLPNMLQGGMRELWLELIRSHWEMPLKCYPLWIKNTHQFPLQLKFLASSSFLMASVTIFSILISLKFIIFLWSSDLCHHRCFFFK